MVTLSSPFTISFCESSLCTNLASFLGLAAFSVCKNRERRFGDSYHIICCRPLSSQGIGPVLHTTSHETPVSCQTTCLTYSAVTKKKWPHFQSYLYIGSVSNPGHLAWAARALPLSHDCRTTTNPHNSLYVLHRWYYKCLSRTLGSHPVCVVRTLLGVE